MVKSQQVVTKTFNTSNPTTGAAADATGTPTGTLLVNGVANAATVTVTNLATGRYKASVTLPSLAAGDVCDIVISATVATVAGEAVIWSDIADTAYVSENPAKYANGKVWVNSVTGSAGTVPFVNGIMSNPSDTIANAKSIADNAAVKCKGFWIQAGSAVVVSADMPNYVFDGRGYSLQVSVAAADRNMSGSHFSYVEGFSTIGGNSITCDNGEVVVVDSHLLDLRIGEADFVRCHLNGTVTCTQATVPYRFDSCHGVGALSKITLAAATQTLQVSRWGGYLTLAGLTAAKTAYIDGDGELVLDATCTGGTVYISGNMTLTNNATGVVTIIDTSRYDEADVNVTVPTPTFSGTVEFNGTVNQPAQSTDPIVAAVQAVTINQAAQDTTPIVQAVQGVTINQAPQDTTPIVQAVQGVTINQAAQDTAPIVEAIEELTLGLTLTEQEIASIAASVWSSVTRTLTSIDGIEIDTVAVSQAIVSELMTRVSSGSGLFIGPGWGDIRYDDTLEKSPGHPITGARVRVYPREGLITDWTDCQGECWTDNNGEYHLDLDAGTYARRVWKNGTVILDDTITVTEPVGI